MNISKDHVLYAAVFILLFGSLLLSLLIPAFGVNGGDSPANLLVISLCIFVILYLVMRDKEPGTPIFKVDSVLLTLTGLFSLFCIGTIFIATDIRAAVLSTIEWILLFSLFYITALWIHEKPRALHRISECMVVGTTILSAIGFFTFMQNLDYLHLSSLLPDHNPFAGFLCIPLLVSVALLCIARSRQAQFFWGANAIIIGSAFILTFSRGAFLSLFVSLILAAILFRRKYSRAVVKPYVTRLVIFILGVVVVTGVLYGLAEEVGKIERAQVSVYGSAANLNVPTDSTLDRIYYDKMALQIIAAHPLGIGLGNYPIVAQELRTTVLRFAFDPHNIYLRMFAEVGIGGGLIYVLFWLYFFVVCSQSLYKMKTSSEVSPILFALFIGITASLIHNGIDFDFNYPIAVFTFFLAAGMLYANLETPKYILSDSLTTAFVRTLMGISALFTMLLICEYTSTTFLFNAEAYVSQKNDIQALSDYTLAEKFDPLNYSAYIDESQVYYNFASAVSGDARTHYENLALSKLQTSLLIDRINPDAFADESLVYQEENNLPDALKYQKEAVAADPTNNLDRHISLVALYAEDHDYTDALALIQSVTNTFPPQLFTSPVWGDPSKALWLKDVTNLVTIEIAIYTVEKNTTQLTASEQLYNQYQALAPKSY